MGGWKGKPQYGNTGRNNTIQADYGTANQQVTPVILYSVYTMGEGMSETSNTEYPYVSEGEEDTDRYLKHASGTTLTVLQIILTFILIFCTQLRFHTAQNTVVWCLQLLMQ